MRLNKTANIVHTTFHIPTCGYLSTLFEPSKVIDRLQDVDVIIIDEMLMMTSYMLCTMEQRLKQAMRVKNSSPFKTKLVLFIGYLTQLPTICKHNLHNNELIYRTCQIKFVSCWLLAQQHYLLILV